MAVEITFIRHGQTTGNAAGRWQGHTNSSLTALGEDQAAQLGRRLAGKQFDLVVASDLDRTVETAAALHRPLETDERWREPFFGDWEDLESDEIMKRHGAELTSLLNGEDIALGGGERLSEVMERTSAALTDVVGRVGDGSVAIVSHGMALLTLLSGLLETKRPSPLRLLGNTAIATMNVDDGAISVTRYNDHTHLPEGGASHFGHAAEDTQVFLVRHGETISNQARRWQGHQDGTLSETGRTQAVRLGSALPQVDALYSSPLTRAAETAEEIAAQQDVTVTFNTGLKEIGFGAWEGMTQPEIAAKYPDEYAAFRNGSDAARGGTGETFAGVRRRMAESLGDIARRHPGENVGVVSHGGATRAWVTEILGIPYENRNRLSILDNTGYARVAFTVRGPALVNWNLAPHLT